MTDQPELLLILLAHGGGCGCKIAPAVLQDILRGTTAMPVSPELLVGIETSDDAAVWQINAHQAVVATTDFFMPVVDDPRDFGRIAATNAISDVYAIGGDADFCAGPGGDAGELLSPQTIGRILDGGAEACRAAGIVIAGGHTIDAVEPFYGLVAIGLADPAPIRRNRDARPGDVLVLGKPLGVGVYSLALKKGVLDAAGHEAMIGSTTRLNTPDPDP